MNEIKLLEAEISNNPHNVHMSRIYNNKNVQIAHVLLQPGESITPHSAPAQAFFYVIQGTGIVTIGDEEKEINSDTLIEAPPDIAHGWANKSNEVLRILVIKIPG